MNPGGAPHYAPLFAIPIVLLVLFLRMRRLQQGRRLRLEWLWILPALVLAATVAAMAPSPPRGLDWAWLALALVVGSVLGWYRGRMMHIEVDPQTHALNTRASPAAVMFIIALVAIRYALRALAVGEAHAWHVSVALITDGFLVFALGLLGLQRVEMWLRATRLLAEARGGAGLRTTP